MNDNKEWQRIVMALDSLVAAGFPADLVQLTAERLGVEWAPSEP